MAVTDPIADYLTRLRNAMRASHRVVDIPASGVKREITKILFEKGYILSYKFEEIGHQGNIKIALKYDKMTKSSAIKDLQRISKPGLKKISRSRQSASCFERFRDCNSEYVKRSYE